MRILHVLDHGLPLHSGYTFRTRAILKAQQALGWQVAAVTGPRHGDAPAAVESVDGLTFHRTPPIRKLAPLIDEGEGPVVLVVDDGELLKDVEAKDYLRALQRTAADRGRAIVLGGDVNEVAGGFSGWQVDMKGRQGLLINPQSITDGEHIGVRVPRSSLGNQPTAGRAFLNDGSGELELVQVPAL